MQFSRRAASITSLALLLCVAGCGGGQSVPNPGPSNLGVTGRCGANLPGLSPGPGGLMTFTQTGCDWTGDGLASLTPAGDFAYWDGDYEGNRGNGVAMDAGGGLYATGSFGEDFDTGSVMRLDGPGPQAWRVGFGESNGLA